MPNEKKRYNPEDFDKPYGEFDLDKFLNPLAYVETSGGTNLDHEELKSGMHKGDKAQGIWGLMPNTVNELGKQFRRPIPGIDDTILMRELGQEYRDPKLDQILEEKRDLSGVSNTEDQLRIARYLAAHLQGKEQNDPYTMSWRWEKGPNAKPSEEELIASPRVNKFKEYEAMNLPPILDREGNVVKLDASKFANLKKLMSK